MSEHQPAVAGESRLVVRDLGLQPWPAISEAMHQFTNQRLATTADELWFVQHPAVFTQGQAGKSEHLLAPGNIPVVNSDRGGQVTYHGPGQQIMYVLVDLRRRKLGVRALVTALEETVIKTLAKENILGYARPDAPGVYIQGKKVCSLGLRIRQGCSFHGLALNIDMDLSPFLRINPCGYAGLQMTQLRDQGSISSLRQISANLVTAFTDQLSYAQVDYPPSPEAGHPLLVTNR